MDLGETYLDILFKLLGDIYGFIHYNSSVPCGQKLTIKMSL